MCHDGPERARIHVPRWVCAQVSASVCSHLDVFQKLLPVPFDLLQLLRLPAVELLCFWS